MCECEECKCEECRCVSVRKVCAYECVCKQAVCVNGVCETCTCRAPGRCVHDKLLSWSGDYACSDQQPNSTYLGLFDEILSAVLHLLKVFL